MAKTTIQQQANKVPQRDVNFASLRSNASAEAYGAGIGRALGHVGQGISDAGDLSMKIALQEQQMDLLDKKHQAEDHWAKYFIDGKHQGKDHKQFEQEFNNYFDEAEAGVTGPAARKDFKNIRHNMWMRSRGTFVSELEKARKKRFSDSYNSLLPGLDVPVKDRHESYMPEYAAGRSPQEVENVSENVYEFPSMLVPDPEFRDLFPDMPDEEVQDTIKSVLELSPEMQKINADEADLNVLVNANTGNVEPQELDRAVSEWYSKREKAKENIIQNEAGHEAVALAVEGGILYDAYSQELKDIIIQEQRARASNSKSAAKFAYNEMANWAVSAMEQGIIPSDKFFEDVRRGIQISNRTRNDDGTGAVLKFEEKIKEAERVYSFTTNIQNMPSTSLNESNILNSVPPSFKERAASLLEDELKLRDQDPVQAASRADKGVMRSQMSMTQSLADYLTSLDPDKKDAAKKSVFTASNDVISWQLDKGVNNVKVMGEAMAYDLAQTLTKEIVKRSERDLSTDQASLVYYAEIAELFGENSDLALSQIVPKISDKLIKDRIDKIERATPSSRRSRKRNDSDGEPTLKDFWE